MSTSACSRSMIGWLAGCGAATAVIVGVVWIIMAMAAISSLDLFRLVAGTVTLMLPGFLVFLAVCLLTGIPALPIVWLSERFAIRSIWFFGCAGAVTGLVVAAILFGLLGRGEAASYAGLFLVPGFVAGLAYWRVAGRYAG